MHKSFMERLFPHSDTSLLPRHAQHDHAGSSQRTQRISLNETNNSVSGSATQSQQRIALRDAPLSASFVHHDDPFLPVERAARALQETIQSFLDVQSSSLSGRNSDTRPEETLSTGSVTPTPSIATPTRASGSLRTVPIRQPKKKKITLQNARKGLAKSMVDFAHLRADEARLLGTEAEIRTNALSQVDEFGEKRRALSLEIASIHEEEASRSATDLRSKAGTLDSEIQELEHMILELKVRQRHLLAKANQIESSQASKASSFRHTLSEMDKEVKAFLLRPPVHHAYVDVYASTSASMYSLKPERRTLEMAREQWSLEKDAILQRKVEVEDEQKALIEGEQLWSAARNRIQSFEHNLHAQNQLLAQKATDKVPQNSDEEHTDPSNSMQNILLELEEVVRSLEQDLGTAETRSWNLLVCALGPELEAFYQAREMLQHANGTRLKPVSKSSGIAGRAPDDLLDEIKHGTMDTIVDAQDLAGSGHSNRSLQDTLAEFGENAHVAAAEESKRREHKDESEDDDPPPDFMVSQ